MQFDGFFRWKKSGAVGSSWAMFVHSPRGSPRPNQSVTGKGGAGRSGMVWGGRDCRGVGRLGGSVGGGRVAGLRRRGHTQTSGTVRLGGRAVLRVGEVRVLQERGQSRPGVAGGRHAV